MMKSIGQILKAARQKKNLTIDEVYKFIKINPKYLKALEGDDYSVFEGKVHSKGFLKVYSDFLELDGDEIMALWRREYESSFEKQKPEKFKKLKSLEPEKFVITPAFLGATFLIVLMIGFFVYLFFQYKAYTDAPDLDIYYPDNNQVTDKDVLDITGKVELDSEVYINNQKIISNLDGSFITSIKLREGINTISIKANNKIGKETETVRTIIFRPEHETEIIKFESGTKQSTPSENPQNPSDKSDSGKITTGTDSTGKDITTVSVSEKNGN